MKRIFSRTSITVDEAVYMLLGQIEEPIEFTSEDESDAGETGDIWFRLKHVLEDEFDVIKGEYALAKYENLPADVIAEKYSLLQQHEAVMAQANAYLCAIKDELNKGEQSALRIDKVLSKAPYTYITLHSFNEWAKQRGNSVHASLPTGSVDTDTPSPPHTVNGTPPKPRIKLRLQEAAILAEISGQGLNPMSLPKNPPGKRGVKAVVREALWDSTLFEATNSFEKAWERLRKEPRIQDAPPHKLLMGDSS